MYAPVVGSIGNCGGVESVAVVTSSLDVEGCSVRSFCFVEEEEEEEEEGVEWVGSEEEEVEGVGSVGLLVVRS